MASLTTHANLPDSDRFYQVLMDLHRDLDEADSAAANARLILILANHIGDSNVLDQAIALAAATGDVTPAS